MHALLHKLDGRIRLGTGRVWSQIDAIPYAKLRHIGLFDPAQNTVLTETGLQPLGIAAILIGSHLNTETALR